MTLLSPELAIIGGTGLNRFFIDATAGESVSTPYGDTSGVITSSRIGSVPVAFLARHGNPHSIPPHKINYRANIQALYQMGVKQIIAVNAVGGISRDIPTGAIVIPDQIIDYTYGREHTYSDGEGTAALEHIDLSFPFDEALRQRLLAAAVNVTDAVVIGSGVYGVTQGPRLETAAEVDRMDRDGCDIVGMTAMPEAALAREKALAYASVSLVVNPAAGRGQGVITMEAIDRVLQQGMEKVCRVINTCVTSMSDASLNT